MVFVTTPMMTLFLTSLLRLPPAFTIIPTALFQQLYSVHNLPALFSHELLPSFCHASRVFAYLMIGLLAPGVLSSAPSLDAETEEGSSQGVYLQAVTVFGVAQMVWQYGAVEKFLLKRVIFDRYTSGYNDLSWCVMDSNYTAGICAFTVAFGLGVRQQANELLVVIIGQILWAALLG